MQYRSIILELLKASPLSPQLRRERKLLATVNVLARSLRDRHLEWQEALTDLRPEVGPELLRSVAFEAALAEFEDCLTNGSLRLDHEPISLEEVMSHLTMDSSAN